MANNVKTYMEWIETIGSVFAWRWRYLNDQQWHYTEDRMIAWQRMRDPSYEVESLCIRASQAVGGM